MQKRKDKNNSAELSLFGTSNSYNNILCFNDKVIKRQIAWAKIIFFIIHEDHLRNPPASLFCRTCGRFDHIYRKLLFQKITGDCYLKLENFGVASCQRQKRHKKQQKYKMSKMIIMMFISLVLGLSSTRIHGWTKNHCIFQEAKSTKSIQYTRIQPHRRWNSSKAMRRPWTAILKIVPCIPPIPLWICTKLRLWDRCSKWRGCKLVRRLELRLPDVPSNVRRNCRLEFSRGSLGFCCIWRNHRKLVLCYEKFTWFSL